MQNSDRAVAGISARAVLGISARQALSDPGFGSACFGRSMSEKPTSSNKGNHDGLDTICRRIRQILNCDVQILAMNAESLACVAPSTAPKFLGRR